MRTILLVLLCALVSAPLAAQEVEPAYGWDDAAPEQAEIAQFIPELQGSPYFESWDWYFFTDTGDIYFVQFVVSSFGFGIERQGSVRGTTVLDGAIGQIERTDGVFRARRGFEWDDGDWTFERDRFRVDFRDCFMEGDGETFTLAMLDNTMKIEAEIHTDVPMHRPGDGRAHFGWARNYFYDQTAIPRFTFEGRASVRSSRSADEAWRDIRGVGYAEHSRTNALPVMVGSRWTGFRALRPDGLTLVYDDITASADYGGETFGWALAALDGEPVFSSEETQFTVTDVWRDDTIPPSVFSVPMGYVVEASNGSDWLRIVVDNAQLIQVDSLFARVNRLLRAVLSGMMNPVDYDFTVDYTAWVHVDGHTAVVSGRGISSFNFPM